nr:hypothetical protein CFP56_15983 [Quercus suber]
MSGKGWEPARGEIWLEDGLTDRIQSQPLILGRRKSQNPLAETDPALRRSTRRRCPPPIRPSSGDPTLRRSTRRRCPPPIRPLSSDPALRQSTRRRCPPPIRPPFGDPLAADVLHRSLFPSPLPLFLHHRSFASHPQPTTAMEDLADRAAAALFLGWVYR